MSADFIRDNSLYQQVDQLISNFKKVNDKSPEINLAAEMVNKVFQQLITKELEFRGEPNWLYASFLMVFGSYQSWSNSYIMTCAGFHDIGLMALRRAIEFVCYLSKVYKSDERAEIWMSKWSEIEKRKKFLNKFSIPTKYFTPKYAHLKDLLVWHDYASDFGIHGNYEVLADKYQQVANSNEVVFSLQSIREDIYLPIGVILLTGYRILQSIIKVLKDFIKDYDEFSSFFDKLSEMIRQARLKNAEIEYRGSIPRDILDTINSDDNSVFEENFKKLKEKYNCDSTNK